MGQAVIDDNASRVKIAWRLERLPSSSYIRFLGFLLISALFLESVDNGAIGYFLPVIAQEYNIPPSMLGYVGTVSNVGVVVGALASGILADKFGRKNIIIVSMLIWGVFGILLASVQSVEMFMVARIGIGLGLGGQVPTTTTLLSEIVPAKLRATYLTALFAMVPGGYIVAGGLSYFLFPVIGWRGVAGIEALFAVFAVVLYKYLPESAFWLESKGRYKEADAVIEMIENNVEKSIGKPLPPVEVPVGLENTSVKPGKASMGELFSSKYLRSTIMVTLWWPAVLAAIIGLGTWFSTLLVAKGFTISKSIGYTTLMYVGGMLGFPFVRYFINKFGRKWPTAIIHIIIAIAAYAYGQATDLTALIFLGLLYYLVVYSCSMTNNLYTPELYPTRIRGTAMGYANSVGRFGALLGPILIGFFMQNFGVDSVFTFGAGLFLFCGIVIGLLGVETAGKVFTE